MLYYDEAGELQGRSAHTSAVSRIRLAEGCTCEASSQISGPLQWSSGGGSATVRASLEVTVDSFGSGDLEVIAGAELSEQGKPDPNRPSHHPRPTGRAEPVGPGQVLRFHGGSHPRRKTTYPRRARLRKASC